jgi:5-formyltetrahydrofolate cyclo-ligase
MDGTKRAIRQEMRRRRRALSAVALSAAERAVAGHATALDAFRSAPCVIAYVATDHEVPTGRLIEAAFDSGKRVYLPRLDGEAISFAEHRRGAGLRPGARAIPEPLGDPLDLRDVMGAIAFVPLLAWDEAGMRVGRGGGHYDRAFTGAARPQCLVGLGYTFQQCVALPRDPWDLQLDWVVTERGAVRCWRAGDRSSASRKEDAKHNGIPDDGADLGRAGPGAGLARGSAPEPTS